LDFEEPPRLDLRTAAGSERVSVSITGRRKARSIVNDSPLESRKAREKFLVNRYDKLVDIA
jgi:hypothetical protein